MSYDVSIGDCWFNYTWNLSRMFYEHIPASDGSEGGINALDGLTGRDALQLIAGAFDMLNNTYCLAGSTSAFRRKYDAENGWGSTDGALIFLARIMAACAANPRKKVSVS